jgi:hypothetical protein
MGGVHDRGRTRHPLHTDTQTHAPRLDVRSVGIVAAACQAQLPGSSASPGTAAKAKGGEFHGAWPYVLPPAGHYNYFATNAILSGSPYTDLFIPSLGVYRWADAKWDYWLAESASLNGNDYTVKLRSGLKWDDGTAFTSKDVVTTYWIGRMEGFGIWSFIDTITAVDDLTVKFHYTEADIDRRAPHPPQRHPSGQDVRRACEEGPGPVRRRQDDGFGRGQGGPPREGRAPSGIGAVHRALQDRHGERHRRAAFDGAQPRWPVRQQRQLRQDPAMAG